MPCRTGTFCSSRGGGLTDLAREEPWRPPSIILEADPPLHTRTRGVLSKVLARGALERFREAFTHEAEILLNALARSVASIELAGEPVWRLNNTLHGLDRLPVRLHAA